MLWDLRERVNNLEHMDSLTSNQHLANVNGAMDPCAPKLPSYVDVTRLQLGIIADGSVMEAKCDKCVNPRAGWLLGSWVMAIRVVAIICWCGAKGNYVKSRDPRLPLKF